MRPEPGVLLLVVALTAAPGQADAIRRAREAVELARLRDDHALLDQVETTLAPLLARDPPHPEALRMRAVARQARHDFAGALGDLEQALSADPRDAEAWLVKGTVHLVLGEYARAKGCGLRLLAIGKGGLAAHGLIAAVGGMQGRAGPAYAALRPRLEDGGDPAVRAWAAGIAADLAERLGRPEEARELHERALRWTPQDPGALLAWADFLLRRGETGPVGARIPPDEPRAGVLLRRVLAGAPLPEALADEIAEDPRETAMLRLHLGDAAGALRAAEQAWSHQKEIADARVLLAAARAAGRPEAAAGVRRWIERNRIEGLTPP